MNTEAKEVDKEKRKKVYDFVVCEFVNGLQFINDECKAVCELLCHFNERRF